MTVRRCLLLAALAGLVAAPAYGACTNPTGNEADIKYNSDYHTYQFCNGTSWLAYGGGSNCTATGSYSPTTPSGNGYFVLTGTQWTGNLGGRAAADALCLTELTSTYTSWKGYSTANSNGQLVASKVHVFICDSYTCNNLIPLGTYYFAVANDSSAGGATFTVDANGQGPNDSANWSAVNYFNGNYSYWVGRNVNTSIAWSLSASSHGYSPNLCNDWTTSSASDFGGNVGVSSNTDGLRWAAVWTNCSVSNHLICYVDP